MGKHSVELDQLFQALADPTRRDVIEQLTGGPAPVGALAAPHDMALPSFMKHIGTLQRAGLVTSEKRGRQRICRLEPAALAPAGSWLDRQRAIWESRFDRLDALLSRLEEEETK